MEKPKPRIIIPPLVVRKGRQRAADHEFAHRYARKMTYSPRRREFRFVLKSGVTIAIPVAMITELASATPAQLRRVKLDNVGGALELRELDIDISLPGLIRDALGFGAKLQTTLPGSRGVAQFDVAESAEEAA